MQPPEPPNNLGAPSCTSNALTRLLQASPLNSTRGLSPWDLSSLTCARSEAGSRGGASDGFRYGMLGRAWRGHDVYFRLAAELQQPN